MDAQTVFAIFAALISVLAWYQARRSSNAAERSAKAAEDADKHAEKSADTAVVSSNLARAGFENETKRIRASAYWTLYRIHARLLNGNIPRPDNCDLSPVQTLLAVYSHTLTVDEINKIKIALNAMETLMVTEPLGIPVAKEARFAVRDAHESLHREWMAIGTIQDGDEQGQNPLEAILNVTRHED